KVKSLRRNVLFLKPWTLLMLDVALPIEEGDDVTLLYQTAHLGDIHADQKVSTITKEGVTLHIMHLTPNQVEVKSVETPHYLNTLRREKSLIKEGMLTVTAHAA